MTSLGVLENKVSQVRKYLGVLRGYQGFSQEEIEMDVDRRGAVERYLYLAIQATIDLAEALISYKSLRKPATLADSFRILQEDGLLAEPLMRELIKMAGFRNIIAHDYAQINYGVLCQVLKERLVDIEAFLQIVKGAIEER